MGASLSSKPMPYLKAGEIAAQYDNWRPPESAFKKRSEKKGCEDIRRKRPTTK
jgi:hypothetical protein